MRRWLSSLLPDHRLLREHRVLARFASTLLHPALWHLHRRSARGAVAVGLFCGLIPGPLQMLSAAFAAFVLRVNLPLAVLTTLYTNPLTIVPLYLLAYTLGRWLTGSEADFIHPPARADASLGEWLGQLIDWLVTLGEPLLIGLLVLALTLAAAGFVLVDLLWRLTTLRRWRRRLRARQRCGAMKHGGDAR